MRRWFSSSKVATRAVVLTSLIVVTTLAVSDLVFLHRCRETAVASMIDKPAAFTAITQASTEVGHVTETITDIPVQAHLLALIATIEVAGARAAGKGFAPEQLNVLVCRFRV